MSRRRATIVIVSAALVSWLTAAGGAGTRERVSPPHAQPGKPAQEPQRPLADGPPYYGLAIQVHEAKDSEKRYGRMLEEIAGLGADTVLISVNGFQRHVDSVLIRADPTATPPDDQLVALFERAHALGLRVILMPKILLSDPQNGAWRGKINPPTWEGWFTQYRAFLTHLARLAERGQVEVFIVGSELVSTEKLTAQWRDTIAAVKRVYNGRLAYSANWDHYTSVQFWDDLDLLGITTYFKLADNPSPSLDTLRASWRDIKTKLLEFQAEVKKPLLFTEVGWCSQEGCSVEAWNYYRSEQATPAGLEEQRRNYQAFIETWQHEPAVGGMLWWEWTEGAGGPTDFGYTPKNKPAQAALVELFAEQTAARQHSR